MIIIFLFLFLELIPFYCYHFSSEPFYHLPWVYNRCKKRWQGSLIYQKFFRFLKLVSFCFFFFCYHYSADFNKELDPSYWLSCYRGVFSHLIPVIVYILLITGCKETIVVSLESQRLHGMASCSVWCEDLLNSEDILFSPCSLKSSDGHYAVKFIDHQTQLSF